MRFGLKTFAAGFCFWAVVAVAPAHAQEKPDAGAERTGDAHNPPEKDLTGWQWANFLVLAAGLAYLGIKMGRPYFEGQAQQINRGLEEAQQRRAAADVRAAEVDRKLENIGGEIELLCKKVLEEQTAHAERMKQSADDEIRRVRANASQQVEMAGKQARLELRRYASKLAIELAEERARQRMTPEAQGALTGQFVESLRA